MATIKRGTRRSRHINNYEGDDFDSHISPEVDVNSSSSGLFRKKTGLVKLSAFSNYKSNSRSGAYIVEEEFKSILIKPASRLVSSPISIANTNKTLRLPFKRHLLICHSKKNSNKTSRFLFNILIL